MPGVKSCQTWIVILAAVYIRAGDMLAIDYTVAPATKNYCMGKSLNASCGTNEVIVMVVSNYGRMQLNQCIKQNMGYLGCSANVLNVADRYCSGKQSCAMMVPNDDLDRAQIQLRNTDNGNKCDNPELRLYLEASYMCVRVIKPSESTCHMPMVISVSSTGGIISSKSEVHSTGGMTNGPLLGCGPSSNYPWTLEAHKGQLLNISLTDFEWRSNYQPSGACTHQLSYGHIVDLENNDYKILICGGRERHRHIYTSKGTKIKIVITDEARMRAGFLIHYEAIGCPDLIPPKHAWMSREGNKAVIGCNDERARQTWHLTCQGHQWSGVIGNCTQHVEAAKQAALLARGNAAISHEVAICIIIGLALFISLLIIIIGFIILKRYRNNSRMSGIYLPDHQVYEEPKYKMTRPTMYDTNSSDPLSHKTDGQANQQHPQQQMVLGKRNEYTHIWDYPLPEPCSTHTTPTHTSSNPTAATEANLNRDHQQQHLLHNNNNNTTATQQQPPYLQQLNSVDNNQQQYGGSIDSKSTTDGLSRYYALDQTGGCGGGGQHHEFF